MILNYYNLTNWSLHTKRSWSLRPYLAIGTFLLWCNFTSKKDMKILVVEKLFTSLHWAPSHDFKKSLIWSFHLSIARKIQKAYVELSCQRCMRLFMPEYQETYHRYFWVRLENNFHHWGLLPIQFKVNFYREISILCFAFQYFYCES